MPSNIDMPLENLRQQVHDRLGLIGELVIHRAPDGFMYLQWTVFCQFVMVISCPDILLRRVTIYDLAADAATVFASEARQRHGMPRRVETFADFALQRNEELAS